MSSMRHQRSGQPSRGAARRSQPAQPPRTGPGFINPYNFVRTACFDPYRAAPRAHEKFAGLSGRITCELENVTPLCLPDPEASQELLIQAGPNRGKKRWRKGFSRLGDGTLYLPGSSIKGMLRSVAEAASNSCFSILTKNLGVFRDNRSHIPGNRGVGRLVVHANGNLRLVDPCPGSVPHPGLFSHRGLFNQEKNRPHRQGAANKAPTSGLHIPTSVKRLYERMIEDEHFTLKPQNQAVARRPNPNDEEWLLDFANRTGQGDVWWYRCHASNPNLVVTFGRNFRYKWAYDPRRALDTSYYPCDDPDSLCPCCEMFGMVEDRDETTPASEGEVNATAGKISIGPARYIGGRQQLFWIDDPKILGTPKYSCRSFYLHSDSGAFNVKRDEYIRIVKGEIMPNPLRGRKFYWHHTKVCDRNWTEQQWQAYLDRQSKLDGTQPPETDQNAQVQAVMPGARFDFTIDFENLSPFQFGLLLWSLTLPDVSNGAHRLGLGKPIGLGSILLRIRRIQLIDRGQRYASVFSTGVTVDMKADPQDPNAGVDLTAAPFGDYLVVFRSQMEAWSGGTPFIEMPNIADLRVILGQDQPAQVTLPLHLPGAPADAVPITYPPGPDVPTNSEDPHPEELHHNWFGTKGKGWSEPLLTIQEIARGCRQTRT